MATCPHLASANVRPPRPNESVYREDCTVCFDSAEDPAGLDVCLHCFNGGCAGERIHSRLHAQHFQHPLAVNIQRTRKRKQRDDSEPPEKMSKLEIKAESDEDRWDTKTDVKCFECGVDGLAKEGKVGETVQGIIKANTFAQQEEVKAWELELQICEHTAFLEQEPAREIPSGDLGHCNQCDLKENLWLCLTCGNLGCGRRQFGGIGGNNHGLEHKDANGHWVAVKLGSLTAEGNADIYCYKCDEERKDPKLVEHLLNWGINIADRVKTEKSLGEMQLEHNLTYEFNMTDADGKQLKPMFGPELTGLKNLGNTCYLASVVQSLFAMPEFKKRYHRPDEPLPPIDKPAEDLEVQLRKLADGLLSGRYSKPDSAVQPSQNSDEKPHQRGLAPAMLKHLVGRGHPEFSTNHQQDSFELLLHLLKLISRSQQSARGQYQDVTDPVEAFRFWMEQRLQCLQCKKVRYRQDEMENISVAVPIKRLPKSEDTKMTTNGDKDEKDEAPQFEPVTLKQCLDDFTAPEIVDLSCSGCGNKGFTKQSLFKSLPTVLAVNARRFEIVGWVPTKQDVPVIVGDEVFDMEAYRSKGKQPGEEELPEDQEAGAGASNKFVPNEMALDMLMSMGFPRVRCEKALNATGNSDAEVAAGWLFEHMEDPDIDTPLDAGNGGAAGGSAGAVDPEKIENLGNMGFSAPQARQALKETGGDMERAVDWLFSHPDATGDFGDDEATATNGTDGDAPAKIEIEDTKPAKFSLSSIVCHKGSSIHAGHYVAFIKKKEGWVLFNDEKVALGGDVEEMKKFAYIYFFRRQRV
ncbi:hypothetical protein M409DRAFT_59817 [Zasmidium cellare ATCC 36951]|uniref:Ubiquitin carboxyl-terminal hydrolase n=1 Tax=Zasmidium cellare ATCC 36951 TaxID=1080233 RepID=A0A6A6C116_ZASCE|nr:uncharacterized protein M409DRAFT_59817 [Zasmidium cellare ATCC 36951]KAF2160553.1 hypothetical protein M409DRAFT_59817 [Zasmidium cellare ATCC 36951]